MLATKLWKDYLDSGRSDPTDLLEHYNAFAMNLARQQHRRLPSFVLLEDLEASALVGLWKSIERFDPSKGVPFESFARTKINGAILDDIREEDHSSRTIRDRQKEIYKATEELKTQLSRAPTQEELATLLDIDLEDLERYQRRIHEARVVSMDAPVSQDGTATYGENLSTDIDSRTIDAVSLIEQALLPLTKREKMLFVLMYFEGFTLDQCAPILRMTHPMVCQMHFRIADKLNTCLLRALRRE